MKSVHTVNLATFATRTENGSIDIDATLNNLRAHLETYQASLDNDQDTILDAINKVYDRFPHASIGMAALSSAVAGELNVPYDMYTTVAKRVQECVKNNSTLFVQKKGPGGGTSRVKKTEEKAA